MVRTVRTPHFSTGSPFTSLELSCWVEGIDYNASALTAKANAKNQSKTIATLPVVKQTRVLVGQPTKKSK